MILSDEKVIEILKNNRGFTSKTSITSPDFKGTDDYMVFGGKLFINWVGVDLATEEKIDETAEASLEEARRFILQNKGRLSLVKKVSIV